MSKFSLIAIVGAPNVGKSSLTNAIIGQKLSIVSPKVQTTRNAVRGILVEGDTQLVIIDTPGIFLPKSDRILERVIVKSAWQALREADAICLLIDAQDGFNAQNRHILADLRKNGFEPMVVINKVDAVKKPKLLTIIAELDEQKIAGVRMISVKNNDGVGEIKQMFLERCKPGEWLYGKDDLTDAPMRFTASEITREKLFLNLSQEIPYALTVKTDSYKVLDTGQVIIHQTIFVLKESQKAIVVGKNGAMIKQISIEARKDIGAIVGSKIHLYLLVKVKSDWMHDKSSYEMMDVDLQLRAKN